jgi:hypothetical protein
MNIAKLIKDARSDPLLSSNIDVNKLLESREEDAALQNQTFESISNNVFESVKRLQVDRQTTIEHCKKLVGYCFVDELHLLQKGKYVRWIRHDEPDKLMRGGVIIDVQFCDLGANVLCRLVTGHFLRYRFDKCSTYRKLTEEEQLYLMVMK